MEFSFSDIGQINILGRGNSSLAHQKYVKFEKMDNPNCFILFAPRRGRHAIPLQYSCLENPMD